MGKLNTAMRTFLCDSERFADLFNGVFFQGKPFIRADRLLEASETYSDITKDPLGRTRDLKMVTGDGETLRILALENQANIDYTLPYRCEVFAVMNYQRDKKRLYEILLLEPSYRAPDAETLKVMSVILNAPGLWRERDRYINKNESENKEEYDMCQAMRELLADAEATGLLIKAVYASS